MFSVWKLTGYRHSTATSAKAWRPPLECHADGVSQVGYGHVASARPLSLGTIQDILQPAPSRPADLIVHDQHFHVLICREHGYAVQNLRKHLRNQHPSLTLQERRAIEEAHTSHAVLLPEQVKHPTEIVAPIPGLAMPVQGYQCLYNDCQHIYRNLDCIRQHASQKHQWRKSATQPTCWNTVFTQTFFASYNKVRYFAVEWDSERPPATDPHTAADPKKVQSQTEDAMDPLEAVEEQRLLAEQEESPVLDTELEHDQNSDWLRGCGWAKWFCGKPLTLIVMAARQPHPYPLEDWPMGRWYDQACVSPVEDERILRRLCLATQQVLTCCEASVQATPRVFRCWLRSWGPSFAPYLFELLQRD
jgi:hypothetical protein